MHRGHVHTIITHPNTAHHHQHRPPPQESYFMMDKFPIGLRGLINRHDIVFSQALTSVVTSFVVKLTQCLVVPSFLSQLVTVGFLVHWESLLSTMGDELGMLEDFITAIHDLNNVKFKVVGKPLQLASIVEMIFNFFKTFLHSVCYLLWLLIISLLNLFAQLTLSDTLSDVPVIKGSRWFVCSLYFLFSMAAVSPHRYDTIHIYVFIAIDTK